MAITLADIGHTAKKVRSTGHEDVRWLWLGCTAGGVYAVYTWWKFCSLYTCRYRLYKRHFMKVNWVTMMS